MVIFGIAVVPMPAFAMPTPPISAVPAGRIVFASNRTANEQSDIFSSDIAGETVVNLTFDSAPDSSPAWSPNGTQIAFASQRTQNWDVYLMQADGSNPRRLTSDPAYDSDPAWSPDGTQIAFTSSRNGNLDLFVLTLADQTIQQLTDDPAADYGPDWSPDGTTIAFTTWRDQQQEIYLLDMMAETVGLPPAINLSRDPAPDYDPSWSPDGRQLAFISDREAVYGLLVADLATGMLIPTGPPGRSIKKPSWTPSGGLLAAGSWLSTSRFSANQGILLATPGVAGITFVVGSPHAYSDPSWHAQSVSPNLPADRSAPGRLVNIPAIPADPALMKPGFTNLAGIQSGGRNALATQVYPSFVALRQAVREASGHDFLSHLSEAARPVDFQISTASYTSWHKAGRAFDTLFNYSAGGRTVLYITPELIGGRLFWRLYLRAVQQDGTQGAPLTAPVFNPGARTLSPPPRGYFVDFTALAASYGWRRIAAQERETFNWREDLLALEYWHFEQRGGLSWYAAMALVHEQRTLERLFSVERLIANGSRPNNISFLGLPWAPPPPPITGPIVRRFGPR
jgi:TolB protein